MHERRGVPGHRSRRDRRPYRSRRARLSQPWGAWGYLGLATAEQWGFLLPAGLALTSLGIDNPSPGTNPQTYPAAEQTAIGKCLTITQDFSDEVNNGPLAGIQSYRAPSITTSRKTRR